MTVQEFIDFIKSQRLVAITKGWPDTNVAIHLKVDKKGATVPYTATITPRKANGEGDLLEPENHSYIYYNAENFGTIENECAKIDRLLSFSDDQNAKLFAIIGKAQEMATSMQLPADFINPLTAMAEQLRTNILPAPAQRPDDEVLF